MRINNNIMAMNAHRQLAVNQSNAAKSMERLSSGMRINRAGDDAAGLAISEKMRGQIRGLKQAARNAQDGISLIQTAEGALNEIHAILQRMRELAVQSSTDTNTDADRLEIQAEVNELATEITRIAETTEFNTMNLLGGEFSSKFHIGANEGQDVTLGINAMDANALKVAGSGEGLATFEIEAQDKTDIDDATTGLVSGEQTLDVVELGNVTLSDGSTIANYGLANDSGEIVAVSQDGETYKFLTEATKVKNLAGATPATDVIIEFADKVISGQVTLEATIDGTSGNTTDIKNISATASVDVEGLAAGTYTVADFDESIHLTDVSWDMGSPAAEAIKQVLLNSDGEVVAVTFGDATGDGDQDWYAVNDLTLTASVDGEDITNVIGDAEAIMSLASVLEDGAEVTIKADGGIDVSSQEAASKAITTINEAIETVSAERSKLGAMQNRLEHTIANLGTSAENLQAAESRIRDLDMAEEIMAFTKNNILQQAATAMLAQANMAPQSVLQLLG
jgi:flagellin